MNLKMDFQTFFYRLKNLKRWTRVIWNDNSEDKSTILNILRNKLTFMIEDINGYPEFLEMYGLDLNVLIEAKIVIDNLLIDDYDTSEFKEHLDSWFMELSKLTIDEVEDNKIFEMAQDPEHVRIVSENTEQRLKARAKDCDLALRLFEKLCLGE